MWSTKCMCIHMKEAITEKQTWRINGINETTDIYRYLSFLSGAQSMIFCTLFSQCGWCGDDSQLPYVPDFCVCVCTWDSITLKLSSRVCLVHQCLQALCRLRKLMTQHPFTSLLTLSWDLLSCCTRTSLAPTPRHRGILPTSKEFKSLWPKCQQSFFNLGRSNLIN